MAGAFMLGLWMTWPGLGGSGKTGYFESESTAFRARCHQTQFTAHGLRGSRGDGQSEPCAGLVAARLASEEGLKKLALLGFGDARALVADL